MEQLDDFGSSVVSCIVQVEKKLRVGIGLFIFDFAEQLNQKVNEGQFVSFAISELNPFDTLI